MLTCFVSDLHCDFNQPKIIWPEAEVLIIAGDTANTLGDTNKLVSKALVHYPHVVVVDGNHESYSNNNVGRTVTEAVEGLKKILPPEVIFLPTETSAVKIGPYYFIGRNGWYSFDSSGDPINNRAIWKSEMNECKNIGFDTILQTPPWELAKQHASEIREMILETIAADDDARFVVVTHTAPHRSMLTQEPKYLMTNPFYVNTNMEAVLEEFGERIVVWHHGHTHFRKDSVIHGAYILANPRGYPSENPTWEPVVIDI